MTETVPFDTIKDRAALARCYAEMRDMAVANYGLEVEAQHPFESVEARLRACCDLAPASTRRDDM